MANVSVPIEQLRAASLLGAMFPDAINDGAVDIVEMMRQCQYRAEAILEFGDGERGDAAASRDLPDLIQAAKGYIAAANELIDCLPETKVRATPSGKKAISAKPSKKVTK
jgi:hypothetical protein